MQRSLVVGQSEAALTSVREARSICEKVALHRMELPLDFQEVFAWMVSGALDRARATLDNIQTRLTAVTTQDRPIFEFVSGLLALRMGASDRALDHATAIISIGERTGMVGFVVFGHLLAARAHELRGDLDAIRSHLLAARETGAAANIAIGDYVASLVEARLALAGGDRASAIEWLRRAFSLGRDRGFVHHLWFTRAETDELCAVALENAIEPDYVRSLVAREPAAGAAG
jgi:ATP/maltotriose-dependent transcriptional regulator MalT